jgi:hypothetical protein
MTMRSELVSTRFPDVHPVSVQDAIRDALAAQISRIETGEDGGLPAPRAMAGISGAIDEVRGSSRETLLSALDHLGVDLSWYPLRSLWKRPGRGLVGNKKRGDLEDREVRMGSRIGWWEVVDRTEDRVLLAADVGVPGDAYLEYRVIDRGDGAALRQSVYFRPRGVLGRMYWWATYPVHRLIFRSMAARVARLG